MFSSRHLLEYANLLRKCLALLLYFTQDINSSYRGTDQGAQMKIGGTSGFNVELLGYYAYNQVKSQGLSASFISSTSVNGFKYNSRYIGPYENDLVRSVWLVDKKNSGVPPIFI
jgi:hypothetical protein